MARDVEDEVAALYALPYAEFVAARDELAKRLKKEGRVADAAEVKRRPRPTVSAWAVNQLWRREKELFRALLDAGAALRAAQKGGGGTREAMAELRAAIGALRTAAAQVLAEDGRAASEGTLSRVGTTLHAIAAKGSFKPAAEGQLALDMDPPGFAQIALAMGRPIPEDDEEPERQGDEGRAAPRARERPETKERARPEEKERQERERPGATERQERERQRAKEREEREERERLAAKEREEREERERLAAKEREERERRERLAAKERERRERQEARERERREREAAAERAAREREAARARAAERARLSREVDEARRDRDRADKAVARARAALDHAEADLRDAQKRLAAAERALQDA